MQRTWFQCYFWFVNAHCFLINFSLHVRIDHFHFIRYYLCLCAFQSSTQEFYLISRSVSQLGLELQALLPAIQSQISSALLRGLLLDTPDLLAPAHSFLKVLNEKAAKWVSSSMKRRQYLWVFCTCSAKTVQDRRVNTEISPEKIKQRAIRINTLIQKWGMNVWYTRKLYGWLICYSEHNSFKICFWVVNIIHS